MVTVREKRLRWYMNKMIRSIWLCALCSWSTYAMEQKKIPVMGFRSVLRFYELKQIESIVAKVEWFSGCRPLHDDLFRYSVNAYAFIQIPANKDILDVLYRLAEISTDDVFQGRLFLFANSARLEEIARAVHILAYQYLRGDIVGKIGVMLKRDYRGIITWQPGRPLPHYGWSKIELINDQLVIIPYDSHFVYVVDCSGGSGMVASYPK